MGSASILLVALAIDALLGEPERLWRRLPHPVELAGRVIALAEQYLNRAGGRRAKGIVFIVVATVAAGLIGKLISALPDYGVIETVAVAVLLAHRGLIDHVRNVATALRGDGLGAARAAVSKIVGRDSSVLDESGVARAAIESAAENFSDGVIAPVLWYLVLGLPGLIIYKFVNTADSMIGHLDARHAEFGWAAARFDDLLNYVPARLSGAILALVYWCRPAMKIMVNDAPRHRSPNAGWPEAAMAAVLDVALAGPRSYGDGMADYPYVNADGRHHLSARDIDRAIEVLWRGWLAIFSFSAFAALLS